jgi:hypothetical protein
VLYHEFVAYKFVFGPLAEFLLFLWYPHSRQTNHHQQHKYIPDLVQKLPALSDITHTKENSLKIAFCLLVIKQML